MMQADYTLLVEQESRPTPRPKGEPLPDEYVGSPGSAKRRLKRRQQPPPPVEQLLAALEEEQLARKLFPRAAKLTETMMLSSPGLTPQVSVRCRVIEELGRFGDRRAVEPLLAILARDENWNIRQEVAMALGRLGDERAIERLDFRVGLRQLVKGQTNPARESFGLTSRTHAEARLLEQRGTELLFQLARGTVNARL